MSTVKTNAVTAQTTNSALTLTGNGSGLVTIGDGALTFPDADGSASQVIQTDGSGALSFVTAAGGAWTFVSTTDASASATVDFTGIDSSADVWAVVVSGARPTTDYQFLTMRTSTDNGSSFHTSGYAWRTMAAAAQASSSDSFIYMHGSSTAFRMRSTASDSCGFTVYIRKPSNATFETTMDWAGGGHAEALPVNVTGSGVYLTAENLDAIRFMFASGTIAEGTFDLYKLAQA